MKKKLSQHDIEIVKKLRYYNDEWGYRRWPEMSALADQLEKEEEKARWKNTCKSLAYYERGINGDL